MSRLDGAAAVAAMMVHRLDGSGTVTVELPDGVVDVVVDDGATLHDVSRQFPGRASTRPADVAVGSVKFAGTTVDVSGIPVTFRGDDVHRAERMTTLADAVIAQPDRPLREVSLVGPRERAALLGFNPELRPVPTVPVQELICRQAARTPDAPALRGDGVDLTYRELLDEASLIAGRLRADGVGPGAVVGLCGERSAEMVVAVLAILLAGAAYLPLDPGHPRSRLNVMLASSGAVLLLVDAAARPRFDGSVALRTLAGRADLDQPVSPVRWREYQAPPEVVHGLSYVIFTSGSTGVPKGVQMTHLSLANRLAWMQCEYRLGADDVVLQKTPYTFDVSVWELLWAFMAGALLVVAPPEAHRDPREIAELVVRHKVTVVHFVPSMLALFVAEDTTWACVSLRRVICSGEALPPKLVNKLTATLPDVLVHNLYGPTEAAIDVTAWTCRRPEPGDSVPIGRPITNVAVYVLDERDELAPLGTPGELVIGGHCLARGYAGRPDLTARQFVMTSVAGQPERVYRTGDLVRWTPSGVLEYIGRIDTQVKIRGQRVELGEIESTMNRHPSVAHSVVVLRHDLGAATTLVAYVVAEPGVRIEDPDRVFRTYLAGHLPEYMVPSRYLTLAQLPITANGKVDRQALPEPTRRPRRPRA